MDQPLEETEEKILENVSTPEKLGDDIKFYTRCINQIIKNGVIKGATAEQTDNFINEFIPKLIEQILTSRIEHSQGIPMNEYLEATIPLIANFFFDKKKKKSIEKCSEIITKPKSPFYISTMPYQVIQKNIISPFYDINLTAFGKTNIVQLTMNEMKNMTIDDFNSYFNALKLIHKHRRYFDQRILNSFVHASTDFYEKIFTSIEESKLRSLVEKDTKESFSDLNQLAPESVQDQKSFEKIRFNLALRYVKTPFLNKRYYGLSFIKSELNLGIIDRDILCSKLESEKIISYVLDNMHDELVSDFCSIFRTMAIKGSIVANHLSRFWNISIHQNPLTIEPYFSGWNIIYTGLPKDLKISLWNIMVKSDIFPVAALKFIKKISLLGIEDEQKIPLFHVLKDYYDQCTENEVLEVLSDTLSSLVPNNKEFSENLQKECFQLFKEQKQLDLALSLFKASFGNSVDPEKARQSFNLIMKSINGAKTINNAQFLEVIEKVIKKMKGNFTDEEFNNLLQLLLKTMKIDSDSVFHFYQEISMKDSLIRKEQTIQLFTEICKLGLNDLQTQNFIIFLFNKINKSNFCADPITNKSIPKDATIFVGIDDLWNYCVAASGNKASLYLCQLYAKSKKVSNTQIYIKRCMSHSDDPSALLALYHMIRFIESNFEKSLLGVIENRYIPQFDYYSVRLIGDVNLTIKVPIDISFCAFRDRVSVITGIEKERLTFYEGVNMIQSQSFVLFDSLQLEVRKWNSTIRKLPDVEVKYLPSTILGKEKYQEKLFTLIRSENEHISSAAFLILNELPTNSQEKELLVQKSPNWDEIFDFNHKYLLYYRIHAIGHLAENNEKIHDSGISWIDYFYETGGAKSLLEHAFSDSFDAKDNSEQFSILLEICNLIISKMEDNEKKKTILSEKTINVIINQALSITKDEEYESILLLLLGILEKFSDSDSSFILKCKKFKNLFEGTIFSQNKNIRVLITTIIKRINLNDIRKDLLSLIDASVHSKCKEYFSLFLPLVKTYPNQSLLFKKIKKIIYREYFISKNYDVLLSLTFIPPNKYFTWGIFSAANILVQNLDKISGIEKLFNFIIDRILFNNLCYFEVNSDFYSFLSFLIKKEPSLLHSLLPKMRELTQISSSTHVDNEIHLSHSLKPKGLINLGATCYMNSSIQQLFNISEFRNEILGTDKGNDISWFYHLQFLLAQLLLYPTDCIDPTHFVKKWKWYDNEIVNVHEQMDAGEFINLLLSRASDIVPGCDDCFKGIIYHDIIGTEVDFHSESVENFIVFPVEVKDHNSLQESLQSFLIPDEFTGDNMYNADGIGRINANRYHSLMKTPDVLIIQLKRFTYSLLNGEREKLNSRFEFPMELDLDPIMTENVNKAQQEEQQLLQQAKNDARNGKSKKNKFYQGNFPSMPILSIINDNEDEEQNNKKERIDHSRSKNMFDLIGVQMHIGDALSGHYFLYADSSSGWYKYDDNYVGRFDPQRLKYLAFGGIQPAQYGDPRGIKIENNENAYILYYRKRKQQQNEINDNKEKSPLIDNKDELNNSIEEEESENDDDVSNNYDENAQFEFAFPDINEKVTDQIENDILKIITNQTITDPQSRDFFLNSVDLADNPDFKFDYLIELLHNAKHKHIIISILDKINDLIKKSKELSTKLLQNYDLHKSFLIINNKHEVRSKYAKMIIRAIDNTHHPDLYLDFTETIIAVDLTIHYNEFGYPLQHIAEKYLADFDPEKYLEIAFNYLKNMKISPDEESKMNLSSLINAIRLLLTSPRISNECRNKYKDLIFDMKFAGRLFKSKYNSRSLFNLLLVFKDDASVMTELFNTMKNGWDGISPQGAALYFTLLVHLNDQIARENLEWFFKSIKKKPDNFIESFILELESSTCDGMSTVFVNYSKLWIKPFLLSISEKVRMNLNAFFNIIFKESSETENESDSESESKTDNETETETTTTVSATPTSSATVTNGGSCESEADKDAKKRKKHKKRHITFDKRRSRKVNKEAKSKSCESESESDDTASLTAILVKNFTLLTDMVIKRNNKKASLYTNGVSTSRMYPYATYVELLGQTIKKSPESRKIALSSSKEIIEALKKMSEIDMIGVDVIKHFMSLLTLIIKSDQEAKEFFSNNKTYAMLLAILSTISFDPSTRLTSINDVSCLISITPVDLIDEFFKSQVFVISCFNCLNSTTDFSTVFGKFIIENVNDQNCQHLVNVFWSDEAFKNNVTNAPQYFYVSSELMKKFPSLSSIFFQSKHPLKTLQAVSKGLLIKEDEFSILGGMQTLAFASFVRAFQEIHANSKKKSKSYEQFIEMLNHNFDIIKRIVDRFTDTRNKKEVYHSISQLMIAIYPINANFQNLVVNSASKGILATASYENTKSAGDLLDYIIFMLIQKDDSKGNAIEIILNEFNLFIADNNNNNNNQVNNIIASSRSTSLNYDVRKTFMATDILSSEILMVLSNPKCTIDSKTMAKFNEFYNSIFLSNKNINFFTRSTILVLSKLDKDEVEIWRTRCLELIPDEVRKIIKSQKKNLPCGRSHLLNLKNAFEFAFVITNNDKVPVVHKTSLTEIEISQFLKICNEISDPSAGDLSYLMSKLTQQ